MGKRERSLEGSKRETQRKVFCIPMASRVGKRVSVAVSEIHTNYDER